MNGKKIVVSRWNAAGIVPILAALLFSPRPVAGQADRPGSSDAAVEAILQAHVKERRAHVLADPDLLNSLFATGFREVNGGRVSGSPPIERRRRFANYFNSVRFLEWEDVRPPSVSVSPKYDWGEVILEKRVRTIPVSGGQESSIRYVWTERWVARDSGWALAMVTSTERNDPDSTPAPLADRAQAWTTLQRARRAMGGDRAIANVAMLRFSAECQGPRGPFRTIISSARDGRVLFQQEFPSRPRYRAGISLESRWEELDGRVADSLGAVTESVVRAHEMLLLAISPEARYSSPVARPDEQFDGRTAQVVRLRDGLGGPVDFLYDQATGRPMAFRPINQTGDDARQITIRFDDWRPETGLTLPHSFTITQGTDVYRYQLTEISTGWIEDRGFRRN